MFEFCKEKFDATGWHRRKNEFRVPPFTVNSYATAAASNKTNESAHPLLYHQLRKLRDELCSRKDLPIYMVASSATLTEMATYLPQSNEQLSQISGFGKIKVQTYGQQFLDIICKYCEEHDLSSMIHEKNPKRERKEKASTKTDTKFESYKLYTEGRTIHEIAFIRKLSVSTVEGHLAYYVERGEVKIEDLVSREKLILIEPALKNYNGNSITPIKQQLGDDVTFGEIRLVMAWNEFQKSLQEK